MKGGTFTVTRPTRRDSLAYSTQPVMNTYSSSIDLCVRYYAFAASEGAFIGQVHVQGPVEGGNVDLHLTCDVVDPNEDEAVGRARRWAERHYPPR